MPWSQTSPMDQKTQFIADYLRGLLSVTEICDLYAPAAQQRKFNRFREEFNNERPHEALDQQTPASVYESSPREMPNKLPPLEYPDRFEMRYVSANGGIRLNSDWVNVSIVCAGEYVGLKEIDDGIWDVYFGPLKLGRLHERHMRIEGEYGRLKRHKV